MFSLFEECKANAKAYDEKIANREIDTITLTLRKDDIENIVILLNNYNSNWQNELLARDIAHRIMRQTINTPSTNKE